MNIPLLLLFCVYNILAENKYKVKLSEKNKNKKDHVVGVEEKNKYNPGIEIKFIKNPSEDTNTNKMYDNINVHYDEPHYNLKQKLLSEREKSGTYENNISHNIVAANANKTLEIATEKSKEDYYAPYDRGSIFLKPIKPSVKTSEMPYDIKNFNLTMKGMAENIARNNEIVPDIIKNRKNPKTMDPREISASSESNNEIRHKISYTVKTTLKNFSTVNLIYRTTKILTRHGKNVLKTSDIDINKKTEDVFRKFYKKKKNKRMHLRNNNKDGNKSMRLLSLEQSDDAVLDDLDMFPARGSRIEKARYKNNLCERSILIPEGPKYDSKGKPYLGPFVPRQGKYFNVTTGPRSVLPRCCNCCKKSVLGCQ